MISKYATKWHMSTNQTIIDRVGMECQEKEPIEGSSIHLLAFSTVWNILEFLTELIPAGHSDLEF